MSASYGEMMRRLYADPGVSLDDLPQIGEGILSLFGAAEPEPGPPYTHTIRPEPPEYDAEGNELYRPAAPSYTLTERPLAEMVDPDLPAWLVRAAEACRLRPSLLARITAEAIAKPVQIMLGDPIGPPDEFRWWPGGPRTEITASFCQCPACRAERCET